MQRQFYHHHQYKSTSRKVVAIFPSELAEAVGPAMAAVPLERVQRVQVELAEEQVRHLTLPQITQATI